MVQLRLPHTQAAEIGAKFSAKGGTTGGWKRKHWKCRETSDKKKNPVPNLLAFTDLSYY